jgi:urea transport system substrate-binding protein
MPPESWPRSFSGRGEPVPDTDSIPLGAAAQAGESAGLSAPASSILRVLRPPEANGELGRLGPYRILTLQGEGGMGAVFLAEDPQLQRRVALKVVKPALARKAENRERFLREARAAAGIRSDHVVTIHQVGEDAGTPFLAMELLPGASLDTRLHEGERLTLAESVRLGREVAEGLAAAHAQGVVHRDIKPGNLWLETLVGEPGDGPERWRVKILDFGLARAAGDNGRLTSTGAVVGTPAYMAPEQAAGAEVTPSTDLFSLGCVLYELTTGSVRSRVPTCLPF